MSEATTEGRFCIDLPNPDAATALSGTGQSTLHILATLTGASFSLRGLQLEIKKPSDSCPLFHIEKIFLWSLLNIALIDCELLYGDIFRKSSRTKTMLQKRDN